MLLKGMDFHLLDTEFGVFRIIVNTFEILHENCSVFFFKVGIYNHIKHIDRNGSWLRENLIYLS